MVDYREDLFQRIVNVGWGKTDICAIVVSGFIAKIADGAPPNMDITVGLTVAGNGANVWQGQLQFARAGATGSPPTVEQTVTGAMKAYYAAWSYPLWKEEGEVENSTGGGFWFINVDSGAVFPDFVFSPYGSVLAAQNYIDEQHVLHPEYAGNSYIIAFFPPFNDFSQEINYRAVIFLNMAALPKNGSGEVELAFTVETEMEGDDDNAQVIINATLYRGAVLNFPVTANNSPIFFLWPFPPRAGYTWQAFDLDVAAQSGLIKINATAPYITGPASPGGGGGSGPG